MSERNLVFIALLLLFTVLPGLAGCGSTTQRAGTEQLLLSDAVDMAVAQLDFQSLYREKVFLDTTYLEPIKGHGFVNSPYIISSLRQHLVAAGCHVQETPEDADIIVEPRVGALGSNGHETSYGLPRNNLLTSAAAILPGTPQIPSLPEISVARVDAQSGIAKLLVFAYERETRLPVWQSGVARAETTSSSSWVFGAGPIKRGSVHNGTRFVGSGLTPANDFAFQGPARGVDYQKPHEFPRVPSNPRVAGSIGDAPAPDENVDR